MVNLTAVLTDMLSHMELVGTLLMFYVEPGFSVLLMRAKEIRF